MTSLPLYSKLFPFEIPFFLYQFTEHFYRLLYQQYYFQQLANQTIEQQETFNYSTSSSSSQCLSQNDVINYTSNNTFLHMQEHVNLLNMYSEILMLGCSCITSLLLGPLSDIIGRKPIMIFTVIGLIMTAILQLLIIHYKLDVYYYLICAVLYGATGGFGTVMTLMIATIHDVSPKWIFTIRLGLIESCITIAKATTSLGTNNWIQRTNCNFNPPAWLMIVVVALTFTAVLLMPETLSKDTRLHHKTQDYHGLSKIITGIKIYILPWYIGIRNYWQLLTATTILSLASIGIGAYNNIMNYFLHNKPLEWSYDTIGIFGAIYAAAMGFTLIIILPLLVAIKLNRYMICFIGSLFAVVTNILIANVKTDWEMFTIGGFQGLLILAYPTMRSCIACLVGNEQQGAVFSIATSIQLCASILSTIITNEVYRPQINSNKNDAGIIFYVMAGSWFITLPLILLLQYKGNKATSTSSTCCHYNDSQVLKVNEQKTYGSVQE